MHRIVHFAVFGQRVGPSAYDRTLPLKLETQTFACYYGRQLAVIREISAHSRAFNPTGGTSPRSGYGLGHDLNPLALLGRPFQSIDQDMHCKRVAT